jgi:hypothetical protein
MLTQRKLLNVLSPFVNVSEGHNAYFITNKGVLQVKTLPIREQMRLSKCCNPPLLQHYSKAAN